MYAEGGEGGGGRGEVLGIVGGVVTFRFLNGDAIPDENMQFFYTFIRFGGYLRRW